MKLKWKLAKRMAVTRSVCRLKRASSRFISLCHQGPG